MCTSEKKMKEYKQWDKLSKVGFGCYRKYLNYMGVNCKLPSTIQCFICYLIQITKQKEILQWDYLEV